MKYVVMVADGMSDYPIQELGGKTPLESSRIPHMTFMAQNGIIGIAATIPRGVTPASDVANLALLGYDPLSHYTGRGPLEAANMGVELDKGDVAFRCNLITENNGILADYSAGHIKTNESHIIIKALGAKLNNDTIRFYPGISYRHLLVVKNGMHFVVNGKKADLSRAACVPPHDITGKKIKDFLPRGKGAQFLIDIMEKSKEILAAHDINKVRVDLKENPGNMVWLWGQGVKLDIPKFTEKFGVTGNVISAVDLIKGIGRIIGLEPINVPGATGYYDTNYQGKADAAVEALKKHDFVFIHVEAPDEAGHNRDIRAKIGAIENFDKHIVGTLLGAFEGRDDARFMALPDHATPISVGSHTRDPIPFVIYGRGIAKGNMKEYSESAAKAAKVTFPSGSALMEYFMKENL